MFIDRQQELQALRKIEKRAQKTSQMTFIVGRRRVGKTFLIARFLKKLKKPSLYFYVSRKRSSLLLQEFSEILRKIDPLIGKLTSWDEFMTTILLLNKKQKLIVVFDEFQNFFQVDSSVYSLFQKHWDINHKKQKLNWIFVGSVQSMMNKIFSSEHEPLFKRANNRLSVWPFTSSDVRKLLISQGRKTRAEDLLNLYSVFGGIPWYYSLLKTNDLIKKPFWEIINRLFLEKDSILRNEAKEILIEEFGSQHSTYFAILEAIAKGATRVNQIANVINMSITGIPQFLTDLEQKFEIIQKKQPIFAKPKINTTYYIRDQLTAFWFRFIYPHLSFLEQGQSVYVLSQIKKEFSLFRGFVFEAMVKEQIKKQGKYLEIGSYWDRSGHEIDILAFNRETDSVLFGECKTNASKITLEACRHFLEKVKFAPKNQVKNKKLILFSLEKAKKEIKEKINKEAGINVETLF